MFPDFSPPASHQADAKRMQQVFGTIKTDAKRMQRQGVK
jgi:hypothetical protein